jgi:hypothetical protein
MEVKDFVREGLAAGEVIVLVSLDVEGAFDTAWWPSILNGLRACDCPKNLYDLTKSYLSQRTAALSTNNIRLEREVNKGCPQRYCCSLGVWNIQYNSLLNLPFGRRTNAVAFADDQILAIRHESVRAIENFLDAELGKITVWSKNKISFSEEKSKVMLISGRKTEETKKNEGILKQQTIGTSNDVKTSRHSNRQSIQIQ